MKYFICASKNNTVDYAVSELKKYLEKIAGIELVQAENPADADYIIGSDELAYSKWDDAIMLRSRGEQLIITGSNPRSILFAVYDYLQELGCRWPNPATEILPANISLYLKNWNKVEYASSRYRGLSPFQPETSDLIEKHTRELINWMPKAKYNVFFMEGFPVECPGGEWFEDGEHPFQHIEHICKGWTWKERVAFLEEREEMIELARSRGMLIERYGHGWASGIIEHYAIKNGMSKSECRSFLRAKLSSDIHNELDSSMWFQFCMTAPGLKEMYIEHVVDYLKKHHHEVDIAAFWLGDGYDNACQCSECLKKPFSEWFMEILDAVARQVKEFAPELRLEGLVYFMTLEPPQSKWLKGLDNVDFIIAPWNRCYRHALDDRDCKFADWKPDFRHNASHDLKKSLRPLNNDLRESIWGWKEKIENFSCRMFEYFCLHCAPGRHRLAYDASDLARDIRGVKRLGIDGCVSCEPVSFMDAPFFLMHNVSAALMWNRDANIEQLRKELAGAELGAANEVNRILMKWNEHGKTAPEVISQMITELRSVINNPLSIIFRYDIINLILILVQSAGDTAGELKIIQELETLIKGNRLELNRYYDCNILLENLTQREKEIH